jgi:uncharacterized membrane protein
MSGTMGHCHWCQEPSDERTLIGDTTLVCRPCAEGEIARLRAEVEALRGQIGVLGQKLDDERAVTENLLAQIAGTAPPDNEDGRDYDDGARGLGDRGA